MRRPLAVFGLGCLILTLAAVRLPAAALPACAGVLAAVFVLVLLSLLLQRRRGGKGDGGNPRRRLWAGYALPVLAAGLLAVGLRAGHDALFVAPVRALAGTEPLVTARVLETSPGYGEDTVNATLRVLRADGEKAGFKVQVNGLSIAGGGPAIAPGDLLELQLRLYDYTSASSRVYGYGKGLFVGAAPKGEVARLGESHTVFTRLRRVQYAAAANIAARLPGRLGPVAAAMTVGDRRGVDAAITGAYWAAGVSHLMVVSGLHLSLVCAMADTLFAPLRRKKPKAAAVVGVLVVVLFALLAGLTASVVRSGVVWLMLYAARLLGRRADSLTALGLAALLLVLQNPWAAANVGLLLSFTATLGALLGGQLNGWLHKRKHMRKRAGQALPPGPTGAKEASIPRIAAEWLAGQARDTALVSLCVTAATLPVLVYAGMSFSLPGIPINVVMVPLLPLVVVCGFLMAIPAGIPLLGWLGAPASVIGGLVLRFFEIITSWCLAQRWAFVPVGGLFGLVAVLAVYALIAAGIKGRRLKVLAPAALALAVSAFALHLALDAGTVRVTAAGTGTNASLVVTSGGRAAVLYRSRLSIGAVERVLTQNGVTECALLVDLRATAESTEYLDRLAPQTVVAAGDDLVAGGVYAPMEGIEITVVRQGGGTVACVDVAGYKVGAYTGSVALLGYAPLDVLLAGGGAAEGDYRALITGGAVPEWAGPEAEILHSGGEATLWIRPGKSVVYKEVENGEA